MVMFWPPQPRTPTGWLALPAPLAFSTSAGVPLNATVTYRRLDAFNDSDDIFAQSNKTNDNPNTYNWKTNTGVNKDDLNNVYVHISIDGSGHRWVTASADRLNNGGTAFADFELNQATVTKVTDVGCSSPPCGHS